MADESQIDFAAVVEEGVRPAEEESLFARDIDGQLIRVEKATGDDFDTRINLTVDGQSITVPKAMPTRDSQGSIIRDADGKPVPRYTTIYDATTQAFVHSPGDHHPIATLCHREHLPPIGVCRICMVEAVEETRRGRRKRLVPACIQRVSEGMEVHTLESAADDDAAKRVKAATTVVAELLISDHLPQTDSRTTDSRMLDSRTLDNATSNGPTMEHATEGSAGPTCLTPDQAGKGNELAALAARLGVTRPRFGGLRTDREQDNSSQMIAVDHSQCISCGRCIRGCNWLKENRVIGRTGKGYDTRISFDLDMLMGESSCVSCGECAVSCPTGALEFNDAFLDSQQAVVESELRQGDSSFEIVEPEELSQLPLFSGIPFKFLQFNASSVVRRNLRAGEMLCREGEYGATAFIIVKGSFEIFLSGSRGAVRTTKAGGLLGLLGGMKTFVEKVGGAAKLSDVAGVDLDENQRLIRTAEDLILGEMTCMNRYPRSATVVAAEDAQVLEIRRNVLYMLQRNETSRVILDRVYRQRALVGQLEKLPVLEALDPETRNLAAQFLQDKVDLVSVEPGQAVFRQGDAAQDFYIVKLGFVKVTQKYGSNDRVLNYLGPGNYFGEIALLSMAGELPELQSTGTRVGTRTATCTALDHVELVRISRDDFADLLAKFPMVREPLVESAHRLLQLDEEMQSKLEAAGNQDFLDQGLYLAQSLLVLDLERCTRCDECTKACADTHDGVTRLVREGMRFDKYLVASSCRSCMDPYCLVGCPVDAIHRNGDSLEIQIEDYCIGCGLCASNCPYGNINMHGFPKTEVDPKTQRTKRVFELVEGKRLPVVQQRATTCDLCAKIDRKPSCVYACPHNAAFRMSGEELLSAVNGKQ